MAQWKALSQLAAVALLVVCCCSTPAAAITASYEEDALTPPLPFEPAPPGALDNEMRFRQTPVTTVTTTSPAAGSSSAPTPITSATAPSAPSPANATAPAADAASSTPAPAPVAPRKRVIGERPKPMIVYANAVRQSLGNADRALNRVSELYEAFIKSLNDQSLLLKKQQGGFKNDSQIFKNALTDGAQKIKDIQNPLNDIPEVRAKLRATFRALGRNADGSVPPNSTNMAPSFVEVDETATIAAAMEADAREAATVRSMAGASNILERVQDALEELFQQAEVKNQALQDNLDRAKAAALRHKDFIPGLLGEVDSRNRLNEKYLSLLQTQRNLQVAKFREMQPYFLEVLEVNTTASPNATHLMPNTSNITSLVTPISSNEPKDPVNPAVYWPSLLRFLTELNGTVIKRVMGAMDWHTKVTKAHQNLLSHYRKMIENYNLIMNEARAQLALIESACKSVKVVRNKFAEIDADPNVPQFVKDDYKSAYLLIAKIQHENGKKFKQFYAAKSNLLDLIKPMGDSYYVYRLVVVASRNLLTAELNQIVDGWRKAAAVTGTLFGTLKPHQKTLSEYTFKL